MNDTLFDNTPMHGPQIPASRLARRSDPESSREAAEEVTDNGSAQAQRRIVYTLVCKYPGRTSDELAQLHQHLDRFQTARRLPEVERYGAISRGEQRKSEVTGRNGVTWWPVSQPPA